MVDLIIFALWFFAPAGLANTSLIFANKIPVLNKWNTPMDFGKSHRGKRILGDNKRWRGFFIGTFIGGLTGALIYAVYPNSVTELNFVTDAPLIAMVGLGLLLGAGALLGDAVESFFKRQMDVASGDPWFPFDQIDYIIGGLLLSNLVVNLTRQQRLAVLLVWFGIHLISSYIGFLLKLKDKPL